VRHGLAIFLTIFLFATLAAEQPESTVPVPRPAVEALRNSTVMLSLEDRSGEAYGCGTGFILRHGGNLLVTNVHVAGARYQEEAFRESNRRVTLKLEPQAGTIMRVPYQRDASGQDITVMRITGTSIDAMDRFRAFEDLDKGEQLFTLGNRMCAPWSWSAGPVLMKLDRDGADRTHAGIIDEVARAVADSSRSVRPDRYDRLIVVGNAFALPGNSGGAVVDAEGRLVGVVWATDGRRAFIIPMQYLFEGFGGIAPTTTRLRHDSPGHPAEPDLAYMEEEPNRVVDPFARERMIEWREDGEGLRAVEVERAPASNQPAAAILLRYRIDNDSFLIADPARFISGAQRVTWRVGRTEHSMSVNEFAVRETARLDRVDDTTARLRFPSAMHDGIEFTLLTTTGRRIMVWPE